MIGSVRRCDLFRAVEQARQVREQMTRESFVEHQGEVVLEEIEMSRQVNVLLAAGILAGLAAVAAVVFAVFFETERAPTAAPTPIVAETPADAATSDEENAPPVKPRVPRALVKPVAPPTEAVQDVPVESAEEVAETEAEKKAREKVEREIGSVREKMIRDFELTPEQATAAEPALAGMEKLMRSMMALAVELQSKKDALQRQVQENSWTPEQTRQMRDQMRREFLAAHQGELLEFMDSALQTAEDLRTHLTPEQSPKLDHQLAGLQRAREELLKGNLRGF